MNAGALAQRMPHARRFTMPAGGPINAPLFRLR
jgi:hypothetical protein